MRILILTLLTVVSFHVKAWDQWPPYDVEQCQQQVPYGMPSASTQGTTICRAGYITLNDPVSKLPVWVSYQLHPEYALGCVPRSNAFAPDQSLPKGKRAELADYAKSGYDIGHVAPNADMSRFDQTELESFLLTNMMPQLPGLNRGIWKLLETNVRGWTVQRNHSIVVYAGPIYGAGDPVIGPNKMVIPHAFYKIIIDTATNEVAGFLFPHNGNQGNDLTKVRASIAQIQALTGIAFAYPPNAIELPADYLWPVDYKALTDAKKASCGK